MVYSSLQGLDKLSIAEAMGELFGQKVRVITAIYVLGINLFYLFNGINRQIF